MKTTIDIADGLFTDAKQVAAEEGITLRTLVEEGLHEAIARHRQARRQRFKLKDGSFKGDGMVQEMTWEEMRDVIYKGRGA